MARLQNAGKGAELTKDEVGFLVFGSDLLSGFENPFGSDAAADAAYRTHEKKLLEIFQARRGPGELPCRWYSVRGLSQPRVERLPGAVKSKGFCPHFLREKLNFEQPGD